jgi:hypothetical protein
MLTEESIMGGDTQFGGITGGKSRGLILAFACLALLAGGCSKSEPEKAEKADNGVLDTSRLPRVANAKQIFASPATTIFTSLDSVAQTADTLDKALAAGGWQKYVAPNTAYSQDPKMRTVTLKRGTQALNVFISVAPAQNNATSVQYSLLPLKTDLPFTKDASAVEYSPDRPQLTLITAQPVDKTLEFYREELSARGWSLWSQKLNGIQPAGGTAGELTKSGAYAYYLQGDRRLAALQLERTDAGRIKLKFEVLPAGYLEAMQKAFFNSDNTGAAQVDVRQVPRLEGAKEAADRSSSDHSSYSVAAPLASTVAAIKKKLGVDGWKPYVVPLDDVHSTSLAFKKGRQGLSVSFYIQVGKDEQTSEVTTVDYSPTRLIFALALPDDATDIVFDANRPYLNATTAGTVDATLEFYRKELGAMGWSPLFAADATAHWPNAKLDEKPASGATAYFIRGTQRPIVLSVLPRDGGKTNVEIKVPPFAEMQDLEAGQGDFGLPTPKRSISSGGTGGQIVREVHALVPAEVGTVLAFYRRELTARHWTEETQGAVLKPEEVVLNFSSAEGTAVLKLGHKYDLTTVSIVQKVAKSSVKAELPAKAEPAGKDNSADAMMKDMRRMVRDATADINAAAKPPKVTQAGPAEKLTARAGNDAPVPVPDGAEDVEFDGSAGKLEFTSGASVTAVADFYRAVMKQQGWGSRSSVINNATMVVLDFAKAGKSVSFTIMRMGPKTNVSADGPGLKVAANNQAAPAVTVKAANTPTPASAEDLEAEESQGLPVPKRHTMSEGTTTPFRHELKATVPLALTDVLGFYRRELGKRNWKETNGAAIAADKAVIAYAAPDGPAVLKLNRKDDATSVILVVKNPGAVAKASIMPKPGQAKVLFGNINSAEAAITFNSKTLKVAAGAGTKKPDGPSLDLPPGKYKYSIKLPGRPAQSDEVEVGADETWGLMIGPGGVLALQAY